jgi:hypothetical protein
MLTETEKRNIERVKHWQWGWTNDVDSMAEAYAENCVFVNMMSGVTLLGREEIRTMERATRALDGARRLEITRMIASGDVVAVEIDSIWKGVLSKACVVLTFDESGLIVLEHSYTYKTLPFAQRRIADMLKSEEGRELANAAGMSVSQLGDLLPSNEATHATAAG